MMDDYDMVTNHKTALSGLILEKQQRINEERGITEVNLPASCCCFGSSLSKSKSKPEVIDYESMEPWQRIFEDFLPKYTSTIPWMESLLSTVRKLSYQQMERTRKFQKDFEIATYNIYQKGVNIKASQIMKLRTQFSKDSLPYTSSDEDLKEDPHYRKIINSNLMEQQRRILKEIETQVTHKQHMVKLINTQFRQQFLKHYSQYVSKDVYKHEQLVENIIQKTVKMQSDYVFKMADQFNMVADRDIEQELQKKREITLANQAIDDVKVVFSALHRFIHQLYQEYVEPSDFKEMNEDVAKVIINILVQGDVYKVLICLQRIDNFDSDKDLRTKYSILKGIKTSDFGIDPYFCMCDPLVVINEALKKYNIDVETQSELLQNSTVQKLDLDDVVNVEFKEYFKNNKQHIDKLPSELKNQLYQKAKIRPYQRCVLKFREIMVKAHSPLEKLFMLQDLKKLIQEDIQDFWGTLIYDSSKLIMNRDEQTSILLFIICKAEVPDLLSQLQLIKEFTSQDIQDAVDNYFISDTYSLMWSTIKWISSLDQNFLVDRSYLLKANVQIMEDQMNQRYDKIRIQDGDDKFDPFTMIGSNPVTNSYIDEKSINQDME